MGWQVKLLQYIKERDQQDQANIVHMGDYFYFRYPHRAWPVHPSPHTRVQGLSVTVGAVWQEPLVHLLRGAVHQPVRAHQEQ